MNTNRIGFIGFGEVAPIFAEALSRGAQTEVAAFDLLMEQPEGLAQLRKRDRTGRVRFESLADLVAGSDWILSTVTTTAAVQVARAAAPHLVEGKTYIDLNATAPAVKQEVARIVGAMGAHFVEGAILSAVGVTGAKARILIGDSDGRGSAEALASLGLNTAFYSAEIGRASAFKLLRSIFSKGIEALLIEFLVAGRRAGIQEDLWREVVDVFAQHGFERAATNWIQTHATAHERRYHEAVQVDSEMRALGLDPVMTAATVEVFRRSCASTLKEKFREQPATRDAVIATLEAELGPGKMPPPISAF